MLIFQNIIIIILYIGVVTCYEEIEDVTNEEYDDYVQLVSDVQDHYKASSVFLIYAGNNENLKATTLLMDLTTKFSRKSVLSLTINYTEITRYDNYYRGKILRPLFVVFLNTPEEVGRFQIVTRHYKMSYPLWLVMFTDPILQEICTNPVGNYFNLEFHSEMMIKCFGDPVIWEWSSLHEGQTKIETFALWDTLMGFRLLTNASLYERRHTLDGKNLLVANVKGPFIEQNGMQSGLFAKILVELSSSLHFSFTILYNEEAYGMFDDDTQRWSGVIGRLTNGDVDIGVSEFTMTGKRLNDVDFTVPLMLSRNHLYMREPDGSDFQWFAYFRVYKFNVWVVMEVLTIISVVAITYLRLMTKEKPVPYDHFSENLLHVWGLHCQQSLPEFPSPSPLRIAYFSVLLSSVVCLGIYSACLISYLTNSSPTPPFKSLKDFADDGSYTLTAFQQSADYDLFRYSHDKVLNKMMKQMLKPEELPKTMIAGFRQACDYRVAFYATEAVKSQITGYIPCDLIYMVSGRVDSLGMVLRKHSQYTGVINFHLQKFKDTGIMQRIRHQTYVKVAKSDNKYTPVNIGGVITILLILAIGTILSFIILIFEIMIYRAKTKKENRKMIMICRDNIAVTKNTLIIPLRR